MADEQIEIAVTLDDGTVRQGFARIKSDGEGAAKGLTGSFSQVTKELLAIGTAYLSLRGLKGVFESAISAASNQENAINQLNNSLKLAGSFSEEASRSFVDLAEQLQRTTTFEDDQVLSLAALARNFSQTNDQAKALTKAALDLSVATGVDAETAVRQLGGTLSGVTGLLGKTVPALKGLTEEQLKAGDAIDIVASRFSGAAVGAVNTFSGRVAQLKNSFSDLLEELGGAIIKSPAVIGAIKLVTDRVVGLVDSFKDFSKNRDFAGAFISTLSEIGQGFIKYLFAPAELAFNLIKTGFLTIASVGTGAIAAFADAASRIVSVFAPDSELAKGLQDFSSTSTATFDSVFSSFESSASSAFNDFSFSEAGNKFLQELQYTADGAAPIAEQLKNNIAGPVNAAAAEINKAQESIQKAFQQGLLKSISAGITSVVTAMVTGKDAFKAFGSAIFGVFGDMAIQIGTTLVGIGIGIDSIRASILTLSGGQAIAAGVALIALGALLKSLSGGGTQGNTTGGVATGSGGGFVPTEPTVAPEQASIKEKDQRVVVNVQGDVLDSKETGLRMVEILNDAFATQGARTFA